MVIGTVHGDFHDIVKNIVKMMLEGGGCEVVNPGVDVSPGSFVSAVQTDEPQFLLLSARTTLTIGSMRKTKRAIDGPGVRQQVGIGTDGVPVTQRFADEMGADCCRSGAHGCVENCNPLLA